MFIEFQLVLSGGLGKFHFYHVFYSIKPHVRHKPSSFSKGLLGDIHLFCVPRSSFVKQSEM
jgi:hypothetical protein